MALSVQTCSTDWTDDEKLLLEQLLRRYASDGRVLRYAKIAKQLQKKKIRDVAFGCNSMNKTESGKRKQCDNGSSRKHKDKTVKLTKQQTKPPSHDANHAQSSSPSMDIDDVISYKGIGGMAGKLLQQNAKAMDQISANLSALNVHDNINLLCRTKDNINTLLEKLNQMPVTRLMPPLPVRLNEELVDTLSRMKS